MVHRDFFWLHIKKAAGITTRRLLAPYYREVDRTHWPGNFVQASPDEYNDTLNNYRVVLGKYQFRRCLFAKTYLYPDTWEDLISFAFAREPVDRCLSMFHYLYWKDSPGRETLRQAFRSRFHPLRVVRAKAYAFDAFLDRIESAHQGDSIYEPLGLHFSTHTAPMWGDVTDDQDRILIKRIYRLENLVTGLNEVFESCGLERRLRSNTVALNRTESRTDFSPTRSQVARIKAVYENDFGLYEKAR